MFAIRFIVLLAVNNVFLSVFGFSNRPSPRRLFIAALAKAALSGISFCFRAFVGRPPEGWGGVCVGGGS